MRKFLYDETFMAAGVTSQILDLGAVGRKAVYVVQIPKTGTISKINVPGYVALPAGLTVAVSVETLDATNGRPTGTAYGGMTAGSFNSSGTAPTTISVSLGTPATATAGDFVAIVLTTTAYTSGAWSVFSVLSQPSIKFPYCLYYIPTTWGKVQGGVPVSVEYDDASTGFFPYIPAIRDTAVTVSTSQTYREVATKFTVPAGMTVSVLGFRSMARTSGNQNCTFYLYDSSNTVLATYSHDKDYAFAGDDNSFQDGRFSSAVSLTAGQTYYLAMANNTTGTNYMYAYCLNSGTLANDYYGYPFAPRFVRRGTIGSTAWVEDTVYTLGAIIPFFDITIAAPGGLLVHPGMSGGIRG